MKSYWAVLAAVAAVVLVANLAIGTVTLARSRRDSVSIGALVVSYTAVTDRRAVEIAILQSRLEQAAKENEQLRAEIAKLKGGK